MLEGYNHQQEALFDKTRQESVEAITPRARGGGRGVHNRQVVVCICPIFCLDSFHSFLLPNGTHDSKSYT